MSGDNFDVLKLKESFKKCLSDDTTTVSVTEYVEAFEEIIKFLNSLGTVFSFVSMDVRQKVKGIQVYLRDESIKQHYQDVKSMVKYEVDNSLIQYDAYVSPTGTRNLLRLHRALLFVIDFLRKVEKMNLTDGCSELAINSYDERLSMFHPWVVQKAARLALMILPTKAGLIEKTGGDPTSEQSVDSYVATLMESVEYMQAVFDRVQEIYKQSNVLNLY